jgi:hypothetical protein
MKQNFIYRQTLVCVCCELCRGAGCGWWEEGGVFSTINMINTGSTLPSIYGRLRSWWACTSCPRNILWLLFCRYWMAPRSTTAPGWNGLSSVSPPASSAPYWWGTGRICLELMGMFCMSMSFVMVCVSARFPLWCRNRIDSTFPVGSSSVF